VQEPALFEPPHQSPRKKKLVSASRESVLFRMERIEAMQDALEIALEGLIRRSFHGLGGNTRADVNFVALVLRILPDFSLFCRTKPLILLI